MISKFTSSNKTDFYITSQERLNAVLELIKQARIFAIDTEFTRENTYYPILSIIQIAVKNPQGQKEFFIIDCLSDIDLTQLFAIVSDPEIVKIFHSPLQDLQIFHQKSQSMPHGVIDTQLMANFCNIGFNVGYSRLVENLFGKTLDKKQQRSDWQRRPLHQKQIEYALLDVAFLEEIYEKLFQELTKQNRVDWYFEEMRSFLNKVLFRSDDELFKNFSFRGKDSKQVYQIKNLILCREIWAKRVNVPRRHLLKDEMIEKMVSNSYNKDFVGLNLHDEMVDQIIKILGENGEYVEKQRKHIMSERQKSCYQEAKKLIQNIADNHGIESRFLLTTYDLKNFIFDLDVFYEKVSGWRYQLFGNELEQLILNYRQVG